mmetsp:Transcript_101884/g.164251  ORF Transcript_101884/g.164251 Transcript_101884/m.164251 type:complete len:208 (+) Transcript_101884:285-908(+)
MYSERACSCPWSVCGAFPPWALNCCRAADARAHSCSFSRSSEFICFLVPGIGFIASLACSCPATKGRSSAGLCRCVVLCLSNCRASGACARVCSFPRSSKFFCLLLAVTGSITRLACTCPAPKGRSRAGVSMCWVLDLALMLGFIGCRVHWANTAWGVDSPPSCRLLLPACSLPSSGGWGRAGWALRSCCAGLVVVGAARCSVGSVA